MTYGIKVSKPNFDIKTAALKNILFHSDYAMFKYHLNTTASMTINAGDTTKTITIPHGLNYVPAFLAYSGDADYIKMLPLRRTYGLINYDTHFYTYADETNIYITWKSAQPYNEDIYYLNSVYNNSDVNPAAWVGRTSTGSHNTGLQYSGIALNKDQSIESATIDWKASDVGDGTEDIKMTIWGIDVDNCSDFGTDLGQTKTTATHNQTQSKLSKGDHFGINVINELEEIISRANWTSGNNMGFYVFDNGTSSTGNNYLGSLPDNEIILKIVKSGSFTYSFRILVFKDKIHS